MIFQTTHNNRTITVDAEYELVEDIDGKQLNLIFNCAWNEEGENIPTIGIELTSDQLTDLRDEFEGNENEKQFYNDPYKFYGLSKSDFI